jgi:hypothetical protein
MIKFTPRFDGFKSAFLDFDTKKAQIFKEVLNLSKKFPEISENIEFDLNEYALNQKQMRIANKEYELRNQPDIMDLSDLQSEVAELKLNDGRPRAIPNEFLLYLLVLRGCYGSISNQEVTELINDSKTIESIMEYYNCRTFAPNTMRENLNHISASTRNMIFECQIQLIQDELLDDFTEVLIDSTAVSGNSEYPTDITILNKLLNRINKNLDKLEFFGVNGSKQKNTEDLLKEIDSLVTSISLSLGNNNKKVKQKRKKNAKKLFHKARKLIDILLEQQLSLQTSWEDINLPPDKAFALDKLWGLIEQDLEDIEGVFYYSALLLLKKKNIPSGTKMLSISDPDVGYIQKGGRIPVIGYKPQIARSGNGFICGYITPVGNASDSSMFMPILQQVIENTLVIPSIVSVDDGYSSQENLAAALDMGIPTMSFSGSKGKKLTEDNWDTTTNKYARNKRSAVESIMFTLKFNHNFGQLARRGIDSVHAEQLEKVIAYNFMHILRAREKSKVYKLAS